MDFQQWVDRVDVLLVQDNRHLENSLESKRVGQSGSQMFDKPSANALWKEHGRFMSAHQIEDQVRMLGLQASEAVPPGISAEAWMEHQRQYHFERYYPLDEVGARRAAAAIAGYLNRVDQTTNQPSS